MGVTVHGLPSDLVDGIGEAFRAAPHECADTVVIGALPSPVADLHVLPRAAWDEAIGAARSAFFALQQAARVLVEGGGEGCLLVVVPVHALRTSRGCGTAAVVGSFLATAAQVAAVELGAKGIRVNVLAVGALEGEPAPRTVDAVPLGRLTRPADVGAACAMLAGPGGQYVSGAVVPVDGGYSVTKAVGGSPFADA